MMLPAGQPFIPNWNDLRPFVAEVWLTAGIVAVLLTPFFVRRSNGACGAVALAALAIGLGSLLAVGPDSGSGRLGSMLVSDPAAYYWKVLLLVFSSGIVLMWFGTIGSDLREGDGPEYFTLLLGATLGMALMSSAANLLMVFLSVEMASLPSYVLAGFRKTHRAGAEAALKYVLFGAASTSIMVYGLSLLYGLYGVFSFYGSSDANGHVAGLIERIGSHAGGGALAAAAALAIFAGIAFKIAAVPLHFWCPDVFEGAAVDVTAFLSVASKGAGLVLLLRLLSAMCGRESAGGLGAIGAAIGVIAAVTMTVGNAAALRQTNIKRLLAYSSIAQAGYMLCAASLVACAPAPADGAVGIAAVLLYLTVYLFMNLGVFTVAGVVLKETGREEVSAFSGMGRRSPLLAACMTAALLSLIGLPPLGGFAAKLNIMVLLGRHAGWGWTLVTLIAINTVASLYYYAGIIRVMYLEDDGGPVFRPYLLATLLGSVCAAALIAMLIAFATLNRLASLHGRMVAEPVRLSEANH